MIKAIYLNGFLSFKTAEAHLTSPATLLLGINGSGKTNCIRAIQLLYEGINLRLETLINTWGGIKEVIHSGNAASSEDSVFTFEFIFDPIIISQYGYSFEGEVVYKVRLKENGIPNSFRVDEQISYFPKSNEPLLLLDTVGKEVAYLLKTNDFEQGEHTPFPLRQTGRKELALSEVTDYLAFAPLVAIRKAIEDIRLYTHFNTLPDSKIRGLQESISYDNALVNGGDNLARVLNQFSINFSAKFYEILDWLKKVNPHFKDIRFNHFGQKILITLIEDGLDKAVNINNISDGTLRFLCQLAIFCNPNPGSLIVIDEPETCLHPDMLNSIATLIKMASKQTPVIVATHSPQLLNHFSLNDVLVFEKNTENQTVACTFSASDFEDDEDADQPGRLWVRGLIGGKRW